MKKDIKIFLLISFLLPYMMGFVIFLAKNRGIDISIYAMLQMLTPFLGVIGVLYMQDKKILQVRIFSFYLFVFMILLAISFINFINTELARAAFELVIVAASIIFLILLYIEDRQLKEKLSLRLKNKKIIFYISLYFIVTYLLKGFAAYLIDKNPAGFLEILRLENIAIIIFALPNFLMSVLAFIGEEYGWRAYLTPRLQELYGIKVIILSGIIWGIWHLPLNLLYYSDDFTSTKIYSIFVQIIFCVFLGIFLSYSYNRTGSIWAACFIHYLNNNLTLIYTRGVEQTIFQNQEISLESFIFVFLSSAILYGIFILSKYSRDKKLIQKSVYEKFKEA